jgi:hypothetical protein
MQSVARIDYHPNSSQSRGDHIKFVPGKPGSGRLFEEEFMTDARPVECLGMKFPNDEEL